MSSVVASVPAAAEAAECPVCYESCGSNPKLGCGHGLCSGCESVIRVAHPTQGGRKCPLCRAEFVAAPAPAPPLPVPDRVAERGRVMDDIFALRDQINRLRSLRDQTDTSITNLNTVLGRRLTEFGQLMATQGFAGLDVVVAGNRITVPPTRPPPATEAIARANDARAANQMGAAPVRVAPPVPRYCGVRNCPNPRFSLVQLPGFTRRVWRCAAHSH